MTRAESLAQFAAQPFELLRAMEARARNADVHVQRTRNEWMGVGVSIDGVNYVVPGEQVLEVLRKPATTRVPGSRRWLLGLANVRGTLFPVIDVKLYCGNEPTVIGRDSRIVLVNHEASPVAIVVDQVFGFRRFAINSALQNDAASESPFHEYITGVFVQEDVHWLALDILKLISTGGALTTMH